MRQFTSREIAAALDHAKEGGQALHLHKILTPGAPGCFVGAVRRGEYIAHLFDLDGARLVATARALGVRVIVVDKPGTERQHIDLCGAPLAKAISECDGEQKSDVVAPPDGRGA